MKDTLGGSALIIIVLLAAGLTAASAQHDNALVAASAAGVVVSVWVVSTCAAILAGAAVMGQAQQLLSAIETVSETLTANLLFALLRGFAVSVLVLLLSLGVCFRYPWLKPVGALLLIALIGLISLGAAVAARRIGKSLLEMAGRPGAVLQQILAGFGLLTVAALLPVVGWLACGLIALAGAGALLDSGFTLPGAQGRSR